MAATVSFIRNFMINLYYMAGPGVVLQKLSINLYMKGTVSFIRNFTINLYRDEI